MLAFSTIVRLRLLELPLERDEGEYAYAGQLLLQGIPPYSLAYNLKFPGMYVAYAASMAIFGQSIAGIRLGLLIVNAATTLLVYFLTQRLFGRAAGLIAAASYALLSLEPKLLGPYAHATHFVNLAVVGALLLLVEDSRPLLSGQPRMAVLHYIAAGALLGIAILIKQQAVVFALFAILWNWRPRRAALIVAGGAIVGAIAAAVLVATGVFARFWFWTVRYASEYVTSAAAAHGLALLLETTRAIFYFAPLMWLIAAAGALMLLFDRREWKFVAGYTLAALLAITPGLYFREHYFIVLLPPASMLIAIAVTSGAKRLGRWSFIPAALFALAVITSLMRMWGTFFVIEPDRITKLLYNVNPFVEAVEVGNYLQEHTAPSDRIAILGSEPEIFFYAKRKSATGYIYTYPLMEHQKFAHRMQEEMIGEIERAKPKYLVMVGSAPSWLKRNDSDLTIFAWVQAEVQRGWVAEGVVDIAPEGTTYVWGAEAQRYRPRTKNVIMVYRRLGV